MRVNDQDRFDYEVTREEYEMDEVNGELQMLAREAIEAEQERVYGEYIDAMLHSFYEECFPGCEWDVVALNELLTEDAV